MCLVAFELRPGGELQIIANRDEAHDRPTRALSNWKSQGILAGKDLRAGGTWMALGTDGRAALVTNFRDPQLKKLAASRSRGELPLLYLSSGLSSKHFLASIEATEYRPFNLLLFDGQSCLVFSSPTGFQKELSQGLGSLSNGHPGEEWFKMARASSFLVQEQEPMQLLGLMREQEQAPADKVQKTGLDLEIETKLSSVFIQSATYGTRCSSYAKISKASVEFYEASYNALGDRTLLSYLKRKKTN